MGMALAITLLALAIIILRVTHNPSSGETPSPAVSPVTLAAPSPTFRAAAETLPPTATVPSAPVEAWARELLPLIVGHTAYQSAQFSPETLIVHEAELYVGSHPIALDGRITIRLLLPSDEAPFSPIVVGALAEEGGVLVLTTSDGPRRLVSGGSMADALRALMSAAAAERYRLEAAVAGETEASADLVMVAYSLGELAERTPTPPGYTPLPMLGVTTPTPLPDINLERLVDEQTDSIIDAVPLFHPDAVMGFLENHPWTGTLTWSEQGPRVGGRLLRVAEADALTVYMLNPNDPSLAAVPVMALTYDEDSWTTTLSEGRWFYGHRLEEVLYWMVRRAAERGGQLLVAYDEPGARQAITVIGFRPFEE
jgi:hypothetical protein